MSLKKSSEKISEKIIFFSSLSIICIFIFGLYYLKFGIPFGNLIAKTKMETYLNSKYPSYKLTTDKIYFNFKSNGYTTKISDKDNKIFTELHYSWKSNSLVDTRDSKIVTNQLKAEIKGLVDKSYSDFYIKDINVIGATSINQDFTKKSIKRDLSMCIYIENKKIGFNIKNEQLIDLVKSILDNLKDKNSLKEVLVIYDDKNGNRKESREFKLNTDQFNLSKQEMIKLVKHGN